MFLLLLLFLLLFLLLIRQTLRAADVGFGRFRVWPNETRRALRHRESQLGSQSANLFHEVKISGRCTEAKSEKALAQASIQGKTPEAATGSGVPVHVRRVCDRVPFF
ncbi:MAG: hypothetical protein DMG97_41025 [Acidobacteria bacterium]|nr:MAG: hypothetical protein DMG97_41025 [Acidobacteriota bacterium]